MSGCINDADIAGSTDLGGIAGYVDRGGVIEIVITGQYRSLPDFCRRTCRLPGRRYIEKLL